MSTTKKSGKCDNENIKRKEKEKAKGSAHVEPIKHEEATTIGNWRHDKNNKYFRFGRERERERERFRFDRHVVGS